MDSRELDPGLRETLSVFEDHAVAGEPLTTAEVSEHVDITRRSTYNRLDRLVEKDRLESKKVGAKGRVWWRTPGGRLEEGGESRPLDTMWRDREFEKLLDAVEQYGIFLMDAGGKVRSWNRGAHRIHGYEADEVLGEHLSVFYPDEDLATGSPSAMLDAARTEGSVTEGGWRVRADGSRFWADVTISAIRDGSDGVEGFIKVTRDMTERREREMELRRQSEFSREVLETAPVGVLVINPDGSFQTANDRAADLLGREPEETKEVGVIRVFDDDGEDLPPSARPYVKVFETGDPVYDVDLGVPSEDGDRRWLSTNAVPLRTTADGVEQVLVTIQDVTRRKNQADRLDRQRRDLERELQAVFERIDDAFLAIDADWRITYVNDQAADLVDLEPGEMLGGRVWDVLPEVDDSSPRERVEQAMADQESTAFEFESDILDIWVEVRVYPSPDGLSVYFRDITDRKEREQQLATLNNLYEIVGDVTRAVIDQSTQDEVEETIVDGLASAGSFDVAWIGSLDGQTKKLDVHRIATDGQVGATATAVDLSTESAGAHVDTALSEGRVAVGSHCSILASLPVGIDDPEEPERVVAIPIGYEGTNYGVLGLSSARSSAFDDEEKRLLGRLGRVVGHAMAAIARKRALLSDEVVELEYREPDVFSAYGLEMEAEERITYDQVVPITEDRYVVYGTASEAARPLLAELVETLPHWNAVDSLSTRGDGYRFEAVLEEPPVMSTVASLGGYSEQVTIEDGDYHATVHLPPTVDVRRVRETIRDSFPSAEVVAQRQLSRTDRLETAIGELLESGLTDKQRSALEAAFHAGFFEWPRVSDGEAVAETLGVSAPTFHQHLRAAERQVFDELLRDGLE